MKQVALYTANKQFVQSYDLSYVQQYHYPSIPNLISAKGSHTLFDKQEVQADNLPIQRFCWNDHNGYREIYAAFDKELLDIIGCTQEKFKIDVEKAVKREYADLLRVKQRLKDLQSMNLWHRLCWTIKKIWEG